MGRAFLKIGDRRGTRVLMAIIPGDRRPRLLVKCDCGNEYTISGNAFCASKFCKKCYVPHGANRKYGNRLTKDSLLYRVWSRMRTRCRTKTGQNGKYWGGRGITVCAEWMEFPAFEAWALANGYQDGLSIDRINSLGNYEPSNCEWVTHSENSRRARRDYASVRIERLAANGMLSFGA
jgi:hypothetical protein